MMLDVACSVSACSEVVYKCTVYFVPEMYSHVIYEAVTLSLCNAQGILDAALNKGIVHVLIIHTRRTVW